MENLEEQCLEKLNKILSKFDLKINIIYVAPYCVRQYRLVDRFLPETNWLGLWFSLNGLLFYNQSIFRCLESYYDIYSGSEVNGFQRYIEAYQFIQPLKSSCLEEFIIKMDLLEI